MTKKSKQQVAFGIGWLILGATLLTTNRWLGIGMIVFGIVIVAYTIRQARANPARKPTG
jgi:uncharacterized membrane protein